MAITYTWKLIEEIKHRMEPDHWDPKYGFIEDMRQSLDQVVALGDLISEIAQGYRGKAAYTDKGIHCIRVRDITSTGVDFTTCGLVEEGGPMDHPRRRVREGDILLIRSGIGSLGRCAVVPDMGSKKACISGDVMLVRVHGADPYYVSAFLKTSYGQYQLLRNSTGVSRQIHISNDGLESIYIPLFADSLQQHVEDRYRQLSRIHEAAIEAKSAGDEAEYKEKLAYAEQLLAELVEYVENTIRLGPQSVGSTENA